MKLAILAIGRAKPGPEKVLFDDFARRLDATGRRAALGPLDLIEIDSRRLRGREDGDAALLARLPDGYAAIALDERGRDLESAAFAAFLAERRDSALPGIAFLIGGAEGHGPAVRQRADRLLSFGKATWPHMLVRAMLAEQLYRAVSIATGHPYHRA